MKRMVKRTKRRPETEKAAKAKRLVDLANALNDPLEKLDSPSTYTIKNECTVTLSCTKAKNTSRECLSWIFDLMERNMKHMYEQSDWGWDSDAKQKELTEPTAWHLIASTDNKFIGFSHFRFDTDYGTEVLYCYELQLESSVRRKGLGRIIMSILESIAVQTRMKKVVLTVFKHNSMAIQFFHALGYKVDDTSPPLSEKQCYVILSKQNLKIH